MWFARQYMERENVTIIHGDVVFCDEIVEAYMTKETNRPYVLVDSSYIKPGTYNTVTRDGQVLVMSNKLEKFNAKYCCMSKLDAVSARLLKQEIDSMVHKNMYDQFFEDSLVQMIMFHDFQLYAEDISGKAWSEVDGVDDLLHAQQIHDKSKIRQKE